MDYALPRADDLPDVEVDLLEIPCATNPLGVKGAGEAGAVGSPPALIKMCIRDSFITAELRGMSLYPHFTPVVAKLAGASGVKTFKAWRQFRWRYFRRNPVGYLEWHLMEWLAGVADIARTWADRLHVKRPLKVIYRRYLGDPVR